MLTGLQISLQALLLAQNEPVFRETTTLVTIPCSVTDERGQTIAGLGLNDFRLYVDNTPHKIDHLWIEADLPLLLGIVNDVSESQSHRIAENERAIEQLLTTSIHNQDHAFVVAVNSESTLKSEITAGPNGLRYRLLATPTGEPLGVPCGSLTADHGRTRPVCGGTALWNAVYAAAHLKLNGPAGNKALLILSDGNDTGSTHTFANALEEVRRTGAAVYVIRFRDPASDAPPSADLEQLASETGGILFDSHDADIPQLMSRIAADLRGRYILGFRPEPTAGETHPHSLKVEVLRARATVRARLEYSEAP